MHHFTFERSLKHVWCKFCHKMKNLIFSWKTRRKDPNEKNSIAKERSDIITGIGRDKRYVLQYLWDLICSILAATILFAPCLQSVYHRMRVWLRKWAGNPGTNKNHDTIWHDPLGVSGNGTQQNATLRAHTMLEIYPSQVFRYEDFAGFCYFCFIFLSDKLIMSRLTIKGTTHSESVNPAFRKVIDASKKIKYNHYRSRWPFWPNVISVPKPMRPRNLKPES